MDFLEKPEGNNSYTYDISVTVIDGQYNSKSDFCLSVGNSEHIEKLLSGNVNTVFLNKYVNEDNSQNLVHNFYVSPYIPNYEESYFKSLSYGNTTVTLLSNYPNLRFKILEIETNQLVHDTNDPLSSSSHRTKYTYPFKYAEKFKFNATNANGYYIVVYTPEGFREKTSLINGYFNLAVGEGPTMSDSQTFYSTNYITATTNGFSSNAVIPVSASNLPKTAVVRKVTLKAKNPGIHLSNVSQWRIRNDNGAKWITTASNVIKFPYTYYNNTPLSGNWQFSLKTSYESATFIPGLRFDYDYELGD